MESRLRSKVGTEALESAAAQAISHAGIMPETPTSKKSPPGGGGGGGGGGHSQVCYPPASTNL